MTALKWMDSGGSELCIKKARLLERVTRQLLCHADSLQAFLTRILPFEFDPICNPCTEVVKSRDIFRQLFTVYEPI